MNTDPTQHALVRHPAAWQARDFYRFWATESVRFADLDPLGHVNNNSYGIYFETARIAMWQSLFKGDFWVRSEYSLMRATHIEYHRELTYPNVLDIGVRILRLNNTSSEVAIGIFTTDGCHATSHSVGVRVDAKTHTPVAIPADVRAACEKYM
jgi:acyl-CoA thioester hydrolase